MIKPLIIFMQIRNSMQDVGMPSLGSVRSQASSVSIGVSVLCTSLAAVFALIVAYKIYHNWQVRGMTFGQSVEGDISMWLLGCAFFLLMRFAAQAMF